MKLFRLSQTFVNVNPYCYRYTIRTSIIVPKLYLIVARDFSVTITVYFGQNKYDFWDKGTSFPFDFAAHGDF